MGADLAESRSPATSLASNPSPPSNVNESSPTSPPLSSPDRHLPREHRKPDCPPTRRLPGRRPPRTHRTTRRRLARHDPPRAAQPPSLSRQRVLVEPPTNRPRPVSSTGFAREARRQTLTVTNAATRGHDSVVNDVGGESAYRLNRVCDDGGAILGAKEPRLPTGCRSRRGRRASLCATRSVRYRLGGRVAAVRPQNSDAGIGGEVSSPQTSTGWRAAAGRSSRAAGRATAPARQVRRADVDRGPGRR